MSEPEELRVSPDLIGFLADLRGFIKDALEMGADDEWEVGHDTALKDVQQIAKHHGVSL